MLGEQRVLTNSEMLSEGPSQQCKEKGNGQIKHAMRNDNLALYTGYQYWVHVQGYEIDIDIYSTSPTFGHLLIQGFFFIFTIFYIVE
jgi:hypothetical protein